MGVGVGLGGSSDGESLGVTEGSTVGDSLLPGVGSGEPVSTDAAGVPGGGGMVPASPTLGPQAVRSVATARSATTPR